MRPARTTSASLLLAAFAAMALAACSKQAENDAVAPGSPGTGNPTTVVQPAAPDSQPGGSSGMAGALPAPGSSGGQTLPGTSGGGTLGAAPAPGSGLNGGLATGGDAAPSTPGTSSATVAPGSPNTGSKSSVGNRP